MASTANNPDEATYHNDHQASDVVSTTNDRQKSNCLKEDEMSGSRSNPHPVPRVPYAVEPHFELRRDIFFTLRDEYLRYGAAHSEPTTITWEEYLNIVLQETHNLLETMEVAESDEFLPSTNISSLGGVEVESDTRAEGEDEEEEICGTVPTVCDKLGLKESGGGSPDPCSLALANQHEEPYSQPNIDRPYSREKGHSH